MAVPKASFSGRLRLGRCFCWLALTGLIALQSWLAYSSAAKAGTTSATYTWGSTSSGDWSLDTNWTGSVAPMGNIASGSIVFGNGGAYQTSVTCDSSVSGISSLSLSGYGYTISGSGSLTFDDGATIAVNGSSLAHRIVVDITASGNLSIGGDAQMISLGAAGNAKTITLSNDGTLTLIKTMPMYPMWVYDHITGNGSLAISSSSSVILRSTNSYTGNTILNEHANLDAEVAGALPSTTNVRMASGSGLSCGEDQTIATIMTVSGTNGLYVSSGATLTVAGSGNSTFSGRVGISGYGACGTLCKDGTGTMTLTSSCEVDSTAVNVNGGTLEFNGTTDNATTVTANSGGTLTGVGTIYTLANNGILSPGNSSDTYGTMTVSGTYTNGANSTVVVHINATDCSKIAVTGTGAGNVILNGGTVHVVAASGGSYTVGKTYTFLTTGGTISGQYDTTVTCDDISLAFELIYGSNYVELEVVNPGTFNDRASTGNQHAVASYLDRQKTGASGDFATVISTLNSLSTADSRTAFDAMSGELFGSLSTIGLENTENFLQGLAHRLRTQSMTRGMAFQTAQAKKWDESLLLVSRHESWLREAAEGWTTWAEGFGVGARLAGNGNASGLGYSTGGLSLGMEKWLDEDLLVGLAGGYSNTYTTLDERSDHGTIDAGHFAVYFQREFETRYVNGMASYGYNAYDSLRHVTIGNDARTAEASYGGNSFSFYTEVGQNIRGHFLHLQPYAALEYIQLHQNGFTETGADSVNLSVGGVGADAFRGLLGARVLSYLRTDAGQLITLEGRAAWRHEFLDDNRILDATFAGQTGTAYAIQGINVDRDAAILGTGLTYDYTKSLKFGLNYDLLFSTNYTANAASGNVQLAW